MVKKNKKISAVKNLGVDILKKVNTKIRSIVAMVKSKKTKAVFKSKRKQYTPESLAIAVNLVKNKSLTYREAPERF